MPDERPGGDRRDPEYFDPNLRRVEFDGHGPAEVFGKATAWLAQRDGGVGVLTVAWHHVADEEPYNMVIYYYPE